MNMLMSNGYEMINSGLSRSPGGVTHYNQSSVWSSENYLQNENEYKRFQTVINLIPSNISSLLDVGAGNGAFLRLMEDTRGGLILKGLEQSRAAIDNSICTTIITCGSGHCIPFADQSFDMTTCLEVIEHLPYGLYEPTLGEIGRVTKSYICISVPYRERRTMLKCHYCGSTFPAWFHLRTFNKSAMEGLFAGFELIRLVQVFIPERLPFPSPRWVWRSLFRRGPKTMGPDTICPSCGFRDNRNEQSDDSQATGGVSVVRQFKYTLKNMMPIKNECRWMVALYSRSRANK
jgi:SAM-dependent methyltransferase